jgi:hypothetical protein
VVDSAFIVAVNALRTLFAERALGEGPPPVECVRVVDVDPGDDARHRSWPHTSTSALCALRSRKLANEAALRGRGSAFDLEWHDVRRRVAMRIREEALSKVEGVDGPVNCATEHAG